MILSFSDSVSFRRDDAVVFSEELLSVKLGETTLPRWERDVFEFINQWVDDDAYTEIQTSGTIGEPRKYKVTKEAMEISARKTLDFFWLKPGDSALLSLSPKYIAGKLMIVRAIIGGLDLIISKPSGTPLEGITEGVDFAAMVPMQVQNQFDENPDTFKKIKILIIGGGEVSPTLRENLQGISTDVWETYGMTETLTHIALKNLNGEGKSDWFEPLAGVKVHKNSDSCLVVEVEGITDEPLVTNDLVEFDDQNRFKIKGRADDVINTGGIKVIPAEVEKKISNCTTHSFIVSSLYDETLGEKVVLVIEGDAVDSKKLNESLKKLEFYEIPKSIIFLKAFPRTETGKIKRGEVRKLIRS